MNRFCRCYKCGSRTILTELPSSTIMCFYYAPSTESNHVSAYWRGHRFMECKSDGLNSVTNCGQFQLPVQPESNEITALEQLDMFFKWCSVFTSIGPWGMVMCLWELCFTHFGKGSAHVGQVSVIHYHVIRDFTTKTMQNLVGGFLKRWVCHLFMVKNVFQAVYPSD